MSKKIINTWVIPDNQVNEFLYNEIDYDRLISEAMKKPHVCLPKRQQVMKIKPVPLPTIEEEKELDIDDPGYLRQERKKRFWNRDLRTFFKV